MEAGKLNRRISLLGKSQSTDSFGEVIEAYSEFTSTYAALWSLTSRDEVRQQSVQTRASAKFLVRYRTDLTTEMRVAYSGVTYAITEIQEYGNREGLFLFVRSV